MSKIPCFIANETIKKNIDISTETEQQMHEIFITQNNNSSLGWRR